ncbi:MAG: Nif3-like dinuclear metal center hexameric protein [Bacteroidota bacterium]
MTIQEFQHIFERMTPPEVAWKGDNVGLQIGNEKATIANIIVSLDPTMEAARLAVHHNANLIVTHHPLFFHPIKKISAHTRIGSLALFLARHKINLYSAHTNLDSVQWGVNFVLAKTIGLQNSRVLSPVSGSLNKITVFVPHSHCRKVADAMHAAGAGTFLKYDHCSFRVDGTGTFRGMGDARPHIGTVGTLEEVQECRLEMLCETWKIDGVVAAMKSVHPYEEIAYDLYPLSNPNTEYGLGAIGELKTPMTPQKFLRHLRKAFRTPFLRFTPGASRIIATIAVCGGSGSEFVDEALRQGADAMVTADIKYHTFQEYENRILLVDAGHFETERLVLPALASAIRTIVRQKPASKKISITTHSRNPVHYFISQT